MKLVITESQLKRIISEQIPGLAPAGGYDYQKPKAIQGAGQALINMDPHDRNQLLQIAASFIPYAGPAIVAGIAAYDAKLYHQQGKDREAAVALVLGLLPAITSVANKIPGVKTLGQKGMNILADKIAKGVMKLTPLEAEVVNGINLNKNLIHAETEGLIKRTLNNVTNKAGGAVRANHERLAQVAKVADAGIRQGVNKVVGNAVGATYDATTR